MNIASIGDMGIDNYVNLQLKKPGGIAFNFAVNVMKSDECVSLISTIGNDKGGSQLGSLISSLDLDTSYVKVSNGETPEQKIILEKTGERKFVGYREGVLKKWQLTEKDMKFISKHDAIFVPLSDGMEDIFYDVANLSTKAVKITDFSQDYEFADFDKPDNMIVKSCQYFDINFVGGTEKQIPLLTCLSKKYPTKVFVLTLGKSGSLGFLHGSKFVQPTKLVEAVVDTTGCGDAFQAAFVCNYLKSKNIFTALESATKRAQQILLHIGSTELELTVSEKDYENN